MKTDPDLTALREFREDLDDEMAAARVRYRITRPVDGVTTARRGPARRWAPAIAAAVVVATTTIGATVLLPKLGNSGVQVAEVVPPSPTVVKPTDQGSPIPHLVSEITLPTGEPGPLTAEPLQVGPGQLLYLRSSATNYAHETWIDVQGGIIVSLRGENLGMNEQDLAGDIVQQRAELAAKGPSLGSPTPASLAGLPTDGAKMLQRIRKELAGPGRTTLPDRLVFKQTAEFLMRAEPLLTPAVRAAVVNALKRVPGARVDTRARTFAGRQVSLIEYAGGDGLDGFYVDTATGRIIGEYARGPNMNPHPGTAWQFAVVTR